MKRLSKIIVCSILMLTFLSVAIVANVSLAETNADNASFYVGVTYGGATVEGAKLLIDKVKDCTNLFILSSGELVYNTTAVEEIGDYAIVSGLNFATSFGPYFYNVPQGWIDTAKQRWSSHFLGIYFYDEPGGKMLDDNVWLPDEGRNTSMSITKRDTGSISVYESFEYGGITTDYYSNGTVKVISHDLDKSKTGFLSVNYLGGSSKIIPNVPWQEVKFTEYPNGTTSHFYPYWFSIDITYYPDGDITVWEHLDEEGQEGMFYTAVNGSARIAEVEPLSAVLDRNPIKTYYKAAQVFENELTRRFQPLDNISIPLFTSDYGLYWWDFRSGYDMVLAQIGWNNTIEQEIALVRGAANLQDKDWGTIITWKYTHAPFLTDGQEMFEQMKISYEAGAEYVLVFNYSEDFKNPNTLQEEHYQALERFWVEVVQNPDVTHGRIKAEAVFVLPQNYGWGMRNPTDRIWGIWDADNTSQQIWNQVQTQLDQYGLKLDIVYDDPDYPVAGRYNNIHYVNPPFPYVLLITAILLPTTAGTLLIYFKRRKNQTARPVTPVL
ncbi:hypothetical protein [Candidatus Bathycorpusculum sp.]|uniref:hypothetical protein n=1 Tax=Candidatus Bathycorpusculum sp. TaxID=2994959 RepID=UPI00281CE0A8|nr:hypothetical protein [Candidatus Termitimicrobium sp.]MCL2431439.1 hypothetical protein [Candidatus Termitimicrobium sp.]